jgi:DNA invertase Pin-like site-specific DNA recombinase
MKLDGYIRVSKVGKREGPSFISPEVQRESIQRWADANNHEIAEWHEELDRSAGRGKKRPVFEALLKRVTAGESDGIVVWKLSRFGRDALDAGLAIRQIEGAGGTVESATEGTQTKLIRAVLFGIAEDELDRIRDGWASAQSRAVDRGVWIGRTPIGYRISVGGPLEEHPEEGPIIRRLFMIAAAQGFEAAIRHLQENAPHRRWRVDETRRVLRNRLYLGEIVITGEQQRLVNREAHPPLTTLDRWEATQALPQMTTRPQRRKGRYPLSGIARCGLCGCAVIGSLQGVRDPAGEVQYYRRMRCTDPKCGRCSITADGLENYVRDRIGVALAARATRVRFDPGGLDVARQELEQAGSDLRRWAADDRARELMGDPAWYEGLAARSALLEDAKNRFRQIASKSARSELIPAITDLEDPEQFDRALRAMVVAVKVKPGRGPVQDRAEIEWTEESGAAATPFQESASEQTIEAGLAALAEGQRQRHPGSQVEVGK